jgi:hypothetical protein
MKNSIENRENRRIIFNENIQYEYCEIVSGRFVNRLNTGEGVDISDGGLGLRTRRAFMSGDVLKLYIPVEAGQANLPVYSLVVWVEPINGYYQTGLRFLT